MTAIELKEKAKGKKFSSARPYSDYEFTEEEMKEFIDQLCKEQRSKCIEAIIFDTNKKSILDIIEMIINAPNPET